MALNECLRSGMLTFYWYFHFPLKRCSQAFRTHDVSKSKFDNQKQFQAAYKFGKMTG